ncbi:MAG: YjbF family lipoprotein [Aliidiomarina sp.]|uniref:YjbF family lipoprotein n=1 Tax=Aliidiomarina sp. TaxID=1872439 RepID=UPI0025B8DAB1|nr:YjbF family lipoprotein [Aliidiomarina sp.]MCH8502482.1 YjbF family lipoprotein [Aliidiomarina sp.]
MRLLLAALLGAVMAGCASAPGDVLETWRMFLKDTPDVELSQRQIQRFPHNLQYVRIADQPRVGMVLGFVDTVAGERYYNWISADRETIVTLHGRAVRISKIGEFQLLSVTHKDADPVAELARQADAEGRLGQQARWQRQVDYLRNGRTHTVTADSSFEVVAEVDVELPAQTVRAFHIRERGRFVEHNRRFTNEFWVEADGHVVQSRQIVAPGAPVLAFTQVKWVGRP